MSRRLIIRSAAEQDMADAARWYEEECAGLGKAFLLSADQTIQAILERPLSFPHVEQGIRRALLRRFPYGVYFVLSDETMSVLAVLHGSRDPQHWRDRA